MPKKFKFKTTKKNKINYFKCSEDILDLASEKGAHIDVFSNKEIIIDGCFGILNYDTQCIRLCVDGGSLLLGGDGFYIVSFENKNIRIKGIISSIEFYGDFK